MDRGPNHAVAVLLAGLAMLLGAGGAFAQKAGTMGTAFDD